MHLQQQQQLNMNVIDEDDVYTTHHDRDPNAFRKAAINVHRLAGAADTIRKQTECN